MNGVKDRLHSWCKDCEKEYRQSPEAKEKVQLWRARNIDFIHAYDQERRCSPSDIALKKVYDQGYRRQPKREKLNRGRNLQKFWPGCTPQEALQQYDILCRQQESKCGICHRHQDELTRRLAVDHDHSTGKVRGLLCDNCNRFLGHYEKYAKQSLLSDVIMYLQVIG